MHKGNTEETWNVGAYNHVYVLLACLNSVCRPEFDLRIVLHNYNPITVSDCPEVALDRTLKSNYYSNSFYTDQDCGHLVSYTGDYEHVCGNHWRL